VPPPCSRRVHQDRAVLASGGVTRSDDLADIVDGLGAALSAFGVPRFGFVARKRLRLLSKTPSSADPSAARDNPSTGRSGIGDEPNQRGGLPGRSRAPQRVSGGVVVRRGGTPYRLFADSARLPARPCAACAVLEADGRWSPRSKSGARRSAAPIPPPRTATSCRHDVSFAGRTGAAGRLTSQEGPPRATRRQGLERLRGDATYAQGRPDFRACQRRARAGPGGVRRLERHWQRNIIIGFRHNGGVTSRRKLVDSGRLQRARGCARAPRRPRRAAEVHQKLADRAAVRRLPDLTPVGQRWEPEVRVCRGRYP
jgi:hypothetical protein